MQRSKLVLSLLAMLAVALAASQSHAQTLTTLGSFNLTDGQFPTGDVTLVGSTLYGMTTNGGDYYKGTIYSLPVTGGTPTDLASFSPVNGAFVNGAFPSGGLTASADGSTLYGMTEYGGGPTSDGNIFSIPVTGGTPTNMFSFDGTSGANPTGNLTLSGSALYGMTQNGGANNDGVIFSIPVTGGTPTTLLSFDGTNGEQPWGSLTLSADGSTLYGMTRYGGTNSDGTIFSIHTDGSDFQDLFSFDFAHGANPFGSLTLIGSTLYGMTEQGGALGFGNIFSIPTTGGVLTSLASFNGTNGANPHGDLTLSGSTLYGMTENGGTNSEGTVFGIPLTGGNPMSLISFNGPVEPTGSLTLIGSTLYGTTEQGGAYGSGSVFAMATPEPSSVVLLGLGAIGLGAMALRRRMRKQAA